MPLPRLTPARAAALTAGYVAVWQAVAWGVSADAWAPGWAGLYAVGLLWAVWAVERAAQRIEARRPPPARSVAALGGVDAGTRRGWNPLDPAAWYYGRRSPRLRQSFATLAAYSLLFALLYYIAGLRSAGPVDAYELPAGGGSDSIAKATVKVQKVIRKKYVINPYSSILFSPPPIDNVDVKLEEETQNLYQVGQGGDGAGGTGDGDGDGSGFGKGTGAGKVRLIRLRHADRGWDKNYGVGGDRNMLAEYAARTRQKVTEQTEHVEAPQLLAFPPKKAPPLILVAGMHGFNLSNADKKALKTYLTDQHGMILGDNLGGHGFHHGFIAAMNELTGTTPVAIPRDDRIHQRPYRLPDFPVVVAHGGTTPLGWKLDGRWVVYYHPGALSDAWRDDHAGVKKEVVEMCHQLGVNVIFYAHREYNQWLTSQQP